MHNFHPSFIAERQRHEARPKLPAEYETRATTESGRSESGWNRQFGCGQEKVYWRPQLPSVELYLLILSPHYTQDS
jgi:hypothetical protein